MYNLLIVDDEPIIVDGLIQLFSELDMGLELYPAYSAKEALDSALKTKIDIIITDMRMPEKSGLQLIDELLLLWPQCRIIFLSGYDEFDYVYDAVKRNIDHYLLKTEDDEVLISAVHQSIESIEDEKLMISQLEMSQRKVEQAEPLLKREFLKSLLHGDHSALSLASYSLSRDAFAIDLDESWLTVAGSFATVNDSLFQNVLMLDEMITQELHPNLLIETCMYDQYLAVWFIQLKKGANIFRANNHINRTAMRNYIKRFLESIQERYMQKTNQKVSFIIDRDFITPDQVHQRFKQIYDTSKFVSSFSEDMMVVDLNKETAFDRLDTSVPFAKPWKHQLVLLEETISEGNKTEATKIVNKLFNQMLDHTYSNVDITDILFSITQIILEFIRDKSLYDELIKNQSQNFADMVKQIPILFDSKNVVTSIIEDICDYKTELKHEGSKKRILIINQYIRRFINEDLSLTKIADLVHLNPSYLSRFYKEQTGMNLSDVINDLKLNKAMELLKQTDLPVNEIAEQLGFNSPSYFTLCFKKHYGLSPQKYRENRKL